MTPHLLSFIIGLEGSNVQLRIINTSSSAATVGVFLTCYSTNKKRDEGAYFNRSSAFSLTDLRPPGQVLCTCGERAGSTYLPRATGTDIYGYLLPYLQDNTLQTSRMYCLLSICSSAIAFVAPILVNLLHQ